jgi:hypothetical protein
MESQNRFDRIGQQYQLTVATPWGHRFLQPLFACLVGLVALLFFNATAQAHADDQPGTVRPAAIMAGLVEDASLCGSGFRIKDTEECTHGPDFDLPQGPAVDPPPVSCTGDGVSGKRVQVMYVRELLVPDRYAEYLPEFRRLAAEVNWIIDESAHATGGHRHIRFVTDADCQVKVESVVVPPLTTATMSTLIAALKLLGYNDPDRKYLMFVDASVYCGMGTLISDTEPGPDNRNNHRAGYARLDNGCWRGTVAAHELVHTLGGVQRDAPNSSGGGHCIDEWDVMCYSDDPYYPAINQLCPRSYESLLDCNHDDYYHTNPPAGSYLATHWNVAQSAFLHVHNLPPMITLGTQTGEQRFAPSSVITLIASATDSDGAVSKVQLFANGTLIATKTEAPFHFPWAVPNWGIVTLTANAYDDQGAVTTSAPLTIEVAEAVNQPPTVSIKIPSTTVFVAPAMLTVEANAIDPDGTISQVEFYDGATLLGIDSAAPYQLSWTTTTAVAYHITVKAIDNRGASSISQALSLVVTAPPSNTPTEPTPTPVPPTPTPVPPTSTPQPQPTVEPTPSPPPTGELPPPPTAEPTPVRELTVTLTIEQPTADQLTIAAAVIDAQTSIESVEFYNDQTLLARDTTAPYDFTWTNMEQGTYTFLAKVYTIDGASVISSPQTVVVTSGKRPTASALYLPLVVAGGAEAVQPNAQQ